MSIYITTSLKCFLFVFYAKYLSFSVLSHESASVRDYFVYYKNCCYLISFILKNIGQYYVTYNLDVE